MGRIESNKGIYQLVEIASQLRDHQFQIDICGDGSELGALRQVIVDRKLTATISCHGFVFGKDVCALIDKTHVVVVPTTTDFKEGFNMVCAEAILAGRPVITSAVCPALSYIREAAMEVSPDDVKGYCQAIVELSTNRSLFEQKCAACSLLQEQFYDTRNGWGARLKNLIKRHFPFSVILNDRDR